VPARQPGFVGRPTSEVAQALSAMRVLGRLEDQLLGKA